MPEIALPAFHINTVKKIVVEASFELAQDLERYRAFYRQAYGADVTESDLLREMARRFMEADRDFQGFKTGVRPRTRSSRRATAAPASETSST